MSDSAAGVVAPEPTPHRHRSRRWQKFHVLEERPPVTLTDHRVEAFGRRYGPLDPLWVCERMRDEHRHDVDAYFRRLDQQHVTRAESPTVDDPQNRESFRRHTRCEGRVLRPLVLFVVIGTV